MTSPSNTQKIPVERPVAALNKANRSFFVGLFSIALVLIAFGISAFWYLTANGPLSLLSKSDRPIALATAFVPAKAPFAFSLLVNPDKLIVRQQALPDADSSRVLAIAQQVENAFFKDSPLSYERDIKSWVGDEVTVACTQLDLDFDESNGQQPGYLLALEIAPMRSQQAKESLRLFWQTQSLNGSRPTSEQLNGVRLLYREQPIEKGGQPSRSADPFDNLGAASALVGNQFVLFANDVRVIRRSLRATETATNLAQNSWYRSAADRLPQKRLGLAHVDAALLLQSNAQSSGVPSLGANSIVASLELAPKGLVSTALVSPVFDSYPRAFDTPSSTDLLDDGLGRQPSQSAADAISLLSFMPRDSAIALASRDLSQLVSALGGASSKTLPDFLRLQASNPDKSLRETESLPWAWVKGDYAMARMRSGQSDWILAVERSAEGVAQLDELAKSQGYNAVPLDINGQTAIAWTKFKTRPRSRSGNLETEILGLHLPSRIQTGDQTSDQTSEQPGGYEIFASSIAAMDAALNAANSSLLNDPRLVDSIADAKQSPERHLEGYLYVDGATALSALAQNSNFKRIEQALRPVTSQINMLTATKANRTVRLFAQLQQSQPDSRRDKQSR